MPGPSPSGSLPSLVWLCPVHSEEFWVPHDGRCPAAGCDRELRAYAPTPSKGDAMSNIERWTIKRLREGGTYWAEIVDGPSYWDQGQGGQVIEVVPVSALEGAVDAERARIVALMRHEAENWDDAGGVLTRLADHIASGGQ